MEIVDVLRYYGYSPRPIPRHVVVPRVDIVIRVRSFPPDAADSQIIEGVAPSQIDADVPPVLEDGQCRVSEIWHRVREGRVADQRTRPIPPAMMRRCHVFVVYDRPVSAKVRSVAPAIVRYAALRAHARPRDAQYRSLIPHPLAQDARWTARVVVAIVVIGGGCAIAREGGWVGWTFEGEDPASRTM